jgi:ribonuclease P protein component
VGKEFPRSQRLTSAGDYRQVFSAPDLKAGEKQLLLLARGNDLSRHRLGLAIAKKHIPTAVKRNLMKRLTREHFRHMPQADPYLDIVVLSRPAAGSATRQDLNAALARQFDRLLRRAHSA